MIEVVKILLDQGGVFQLKSLDLNHNKRCAQDPMLQLHIP
jgi:hypothetical protein